MLSAVSSSELSMNSATFAPERKKIIATGEWKMSLPEYLVQLLENE
jgi:hypothetical protein